MSASVVVFIFNDALIKLASETMPALQAIGLRGIFATGWCVLAIAVRREWRQVHRVAQPMVALRGFLEAAAAITYLVALAYIPFAIATAVNMSTPLFLAVLAVLMLGEEGRLAALERHRRGLRRRAAGDPARAGRHQRLDLAGGAVLAGGRLARHHRPLGAGRGAEPGRVAELGGHGRRGRLPLGELSTAGSRCRRAASPTSRPRRCCWRRVTSS